MVKDERQPCRCGAEGRLVRSLVGTHGFMEGVIAADKKLRPVKPITSTHACLCTASQTAGAGECWACSQGAHRRVKPKERAR